MNNKNKTHGLTNHPLYGTWAAMINRCTNPNCDGYKDYGGRGIKVCDEWLNSPANFIINMGKKPSSEHSLDRINNDGNYCPENCRWATHEQQTRNRRPRKTGVNCDTSKIRLRRNGDLAKKLSYLSTKTGITKEPEIVRMAITELYDKYQTGEQVN